MALRERAGPLAPVQWHGETLGGLANLTLWHQDADFARRTIARMRSEVDRLENIFSLYRDLHDAFGTQAWSGRLNHIMKDLIAIRERQR